MAAGNGYDSDQCVIQERVLGLTEEVCKRCHHEGGLKVSCAHRGVIGCGGEGQGHRDIGEE